MVSHLPRSFLFILCAVAIVPEAVHALWPQPRNLQTGTDALLLDPSFIIYIPDPSAPQDLIDAAERTREYLFTDQLGRLVVGRGADDLSAGCPANVLSNLTLTFLNSASGAPQSIMTEATLPLGSRDEAYSLIVPADGTGAVLSANSTLGLFRGLTTFSQLWYTTNGTVYTLSAPVAIQDSPAYVCLPHPAVYFLHFRLDCSFFSRVRSHIAGSCLIPRGTSR